MLTVDQLAKELSVTPRTIYRLAAEGKIPHIRVGSVLRFDLIEVKEAFKQKAAS